MKVGAFLIVERSLLISIGGWLDSIVKVRNLALAAHHLSGTFDLHLGYSSGLEVGKENKKERLDY